MVSLDGRSPATHNANLCPSSSVKTTASIEAIPADAHVTHTLIYNNRFSAHISKNLIPMYTLQRHTSLRRYQYYNL